MQAGGSEPTSRNSEGLIGVVGDAIFWMEVAHGNEFEKVVCAPGQRHL